MADDLKAIVQRMIDAGESEENIATVIRHSAAQAPETSDPHAAAGLALTMTGKLAPVVASGAAEFATSPNVPKYGSILGQLVGGVEGLRREGIMGAAGGVWAGGKAGYFSGKLAQRIATPLATVAEKLAPFAPTLSTIGNAANVGAIAQMAEPTRKDIGFLGIGGGTSDPNDPAVLNMVAAKLRALFGGP